MAGQDWLEILADLGPDKSHGGIAPHKPLLVLALLDLIEEGIVTKPQIELDPRLVERFSNYWSAAAVPGFHEKAWLPFFHLRGRLWKLEAQPGQQANLDNQPKSAKQVETVIKHANLDEGFWKFVQSPENRRRARQVLIREYFQPDEQARLSETVSDESEVAKYADGLLQETTTPFIANWKEARTRIVSQKVRDSAFRRTVRLLYSETCRMCELRLIAMSGHSVCEGAHIIPFSQSLNDDPRNGLGLCPVHHWCFDEGLFTVTTDYIVKVSPTIDPMRPTEERLVQMDGKTIQLPKAKEFYPAHEALRWHQEHCLLTA